MVCEMIPMVKFAKYLAIGEMPLEKCSSVTTLKEEIEIYFKSTLLLRLGYEGNFGYRTVDSILKLL